MGQIGNFQKEKLVIPVLSTLPEVREVLLRLLTDSFGPIDYESPLLDFNYTDYYTPEMGQNIKRFFLSFRDLVDPEKLAEIKIETNRLEDSLALGGLRRINLDPGLLCLSRFVLATTKENAHRIPLQRGIFGEITLIYRNKEFQPLPWTYPDYASQEYRRILNEIRQILCRQRRRDS